MVFGLGLYMNNERLQGLDANPRHKISEVAPELSSDSSNEEIRDSSSP